MVLKSFFNCFRNRIKMAKKIMISAFEYLNAPDWKIFIATKKMMQLNLLYPISNCIDLMATNFQDLPISMFLSLSSKNLIGKILID